MAACVAYAFELLPLLREAGQVSCILGENAPDWLCPSAPRFTTRARMDLGRDISDEERKARAIASEVKRQAKQRGMDLRREMKRRATAQRKEREARLILEAQRRNAQKAKEHQSVKISRPWARLCPRNLGRPKGSIRQVQA